MITFVTFPLLNEHCLDDLFLNIHDCILLMVPYHGIYKTIVEEEELAVRDGFFKRMRCLQWIVIEL